MPTGIPLGHILSKYVRPSNRKSNKTSANSSEAEVMSMRDIAMHVMIHNQDMLSTQIPKEQEAFVTEELDRFLNDELPAVMASVGARVAREGKKLSQNEIIKAVPDQRVIVLAMSVRQRVYKVKINK